MSPDSSAQSVAAASPPASASESRISIRQIHGKQLLGIARHRAVVMDRKLEHGGTDVGFTSAELFLLSIGSCAMGSVRSFLEARDVRGVEMAASVFFEPAGPGAGDRVAVELTLAPTLAELEADDLAQAALSGGVTGRIRSGTEIAVRIVLSSAPSLVQPSNSDTASK